MKLPLIVWLAKNGTLNFDPDFSSTSFVKHQKKAIDVWVINNEKQYAEVQKLQRIYLQRNFVKKIKPATFDTIKRGTQILYLPSHLRIEADITDTNIQFGFVTSVKKDIGFVFCRYFSIYDLSTLRTLSCSESASIDNIFLLDTMSKKIVKEWLKYIEEEDRKMQDVTADVWRRLGR